MKKTQARALCFLVLLALTLPLLFACGAKTLGEEHALFSEVYRSDPVVDTYMGYTKHETVTDAFHANMEDGVGENGLFCYRVTSEGKYYVYNVALGKTVLEIEASTLSSVEDVALLGDYIAVTETATKTPATLVYRADGKALASASGKQSVTQNDDGFLLGDTFYAVEDGEVKKTFPALPIADAARITDVLEDHVIIVAGKNISCYDVRASLTRYSVPETATVFSCWMLADGKLLLQYTIPVDPAESDFSFIEKGEKYDLHQEIFDPARGKTKKLKLDNVYLRTVYNENKSPFAYAEFYGVFREEVKSVLEYRPIVDGIVSQRSRYVLLSEEGEFGKAIDSFIDGQKGLVQPMNAERYYAVTETGGALLDTAGTLVRRTETLGEAHAYGFYSGSYLYDKEGAPVYELGYALDVDRVRGTAHISAAIFLYKEDGYNEYLYRYDERGEAPLLYPDGKHITMSYVRDWLDGCYAAEQGDFYHYYSYDGTLLFSAFGKAEILAMTGESLLARYTDAQTGATVFARLLK